jgi:hypothetical protein
VVKLPAVEEEHSAQISWAMKLSAVEAANAETQLLNQRM